MDVSFPGTSVAIILLRGKNKKRQVLFIIRGWEGRQRRQQNNRPIKTLGRLMFVFFAGILSPFPEKKSAKTWMKIKQGEIRNFNIRLKTEEKVEVANNQPTIKRLKQKQIVGLIY